MTENFIEVDGEYKSETGNWRCISIIDGVAWCCRAAYPHIAYGFRLDGLPVGVNPRVRLLPPAPKIAMADANLWDDIDNGWSVSICHQSYGTNGTLYTHEEAKVALFVPNGIGGELFETIDDLKAMVWK